MIGHSPISFVCGHRKSGTTLLNNLLDDHSQLAVYPVDLVLLYAYFPEFIRANTDPAARRERLKQVLFADLRQRLEGQDLDVEAIEKHFFDGLGEEQLGDLKTLIGRLMAAFQSATGTTGRKWGLFKETSIEIYAAEILTWFPEARFVHLLRDPRDNFAALAAGVDGYYSLMGEDRNRTLASLLNRVRTGFRMARINREQYGKDRYHILRFEDLTADSEACMAAVADFLGIGFAPSLLKPTMLGRPSGGNAFDGVATFKVDRRNVNRWRERIAPEDAQVIEFHLAEEMAAFGYEPVFDAKTQAKAAAEFYKWQNYTYFYSDRFAKGLAR